MSLSRQNIKNATSFIISGASNVYSSLQSGVSFVTNMATDVDSAMHENPGTIITATIVGTVYGGYLGVQYGLSGYDPKVIIQQLEEIANKYGGKLVFPYHYDGHPGDLEFGGISDPKNATFAYIEKNEIIVDPVARVFKSIGTGIGGAVAGGLFSFFGTVLAVNSAKALKNELAQRAEAQKLSDAESGLATTSSSTSTTATPKVKKK